MARQQVKIQKKRFFIDGLVKLRNAEFKRFITRLFITNCKNKHKKARQKSNTAAFHRNLYCVTPDSELLTPN